MTELRSLDVKMMNTESPFITKSTSGSTRTGGPQLQRTRSSKVGGEMHSHESDIYYGASFLFLSNYTSVEGVGWPCQITV